MNRDGWLNLYNNSQGERPRHTEFVSAHARIQQQTERNPPAYSYYSVNYTEDYYPENFTDSEDLNTPDIYCENVHSRSSYPILSRISSSESLDYSPQYSLSNVNNRVDYNKTNGPFSSISSSSAPVTVNPSSAKCRQLPCRTFISTGSCPYGDRCVFLHDASIVSRPLFIKIKKKSKEDMCTDAFFWPTMSIASVMNKVDARNLPLITQPYVVPAPSGQSMMSNSNDMAVYSMWEHFLDFCKYDDLSCVTVPRKIPLLNPYTLVNCHTQRKRLPVFVDLGQQKSITSRVEISVKSAGELPGSTKKSGGSSGGGAGTVGMKAKTSTQGAATVVLSQTQGVATAANEKLASGRSVDSPGAALHQMLSRGVVPKRATPVHVKREQQEEV